MPDPAARVGCDLKFNPEAQNRAQPNNNLSLTHWIINTTQYSPMISSAEYLFLGGGGGGGGGGVLIRGRWV